MLFQTGFIRQGMKVGLELEQEFGFNPLQNGFVAATDSHNSNPGTWRSGTTGDQQGRLNLPQCVV